MNGGKSGRARRRAGVADVDRFSPPFLFGLLVGLWVAARWLSPRRPTTQVERLN